MFRRGADKAEINDLQFSRHSRFIAATSDHNTIHVFGIDMANASSEANAQEANAAAMEEEKQNEGQKKGWVVFQSVNQIFFLRRFFSRIFDR